MYFDIQLQFINVTHENLYRKKMLFQLLSYGDFYNCIILFPWYKLWSFIEDPMNCISGVLPNG